VGNRPTFQPPHLKDFMDNLDNFYKPPCIKVKNPIDLNEECQRIYKNVTKPINHGTNNSQNWIHPTQPIITFLPL
jgi:hypothetical protein